MSISVSFGNIAKRRNSTLQGAFTASYNVVLKDNCSLDRPIFLVSASSMDYNAALWGSRYYFIEDVISVRNNQWEVHCVLDVLATYKSEILASTQYVAYSSVSGGTWLADNRIPLESRGVATKVDIVNPAFSRTGTYILSVIGQSGCRLYSLPLAKIEDLLDKVNDWSDDLTDFSFNGKNIDGTSTVATYQWDSTDLGLNFESLGKMLTLSGLFGNAYNSAPSCIRSCIWIPFDASIFTVVSSNQEIYLGQFATGVYADVISSTPYTDSFTFTIPWIHSDWRRSVCEDIYMYLPLVGLVNLESANITSNSTITLKYSVTPTDGCVAYELVSGYQIIGTYGGSCAANFPIGISQQASAGDIVSSILNGAEKAVSLGVQSSLSPVSAGAAAAAVPFEAAKTAFEVTNTTFSRNNSCVGGIGGGVGVGLDLFASLYIVNHETIIEPSTMSATMGVPTQTPLTLSSCSGFCQCVNAHVAAAAEAPILDAIDSMLNSGFYIE